FNLSPAPSISSLTPNTLPATDPATSIAVAGTNFQGGCTITSSSTAVATVASGSCSTATAASVMLTPVAGGSTNIVVTNPDGGTSSMAFTVTKVAQATLNLSVPSSVTFGATGQASTTGGSGTGAISFSAGAS